MRASNQVVQSLLECSGIEQDLTVTEEISDRGVALHNRLVEIRVKIHQLQDGVLDRMRVGVDQMMQQVLFHVADIACMSCYGGGRDN